MRSIHKWITAFILIFFVGGIIFFAWRVPGEEPAAAPSALNLTPVPPLAKVALIPLDSRPPCLNFPQQLGQMANIEVITPPRDYLDNYHARANTQALGQWLMAAGKDVDAVIISSDMLIHGGLWASRQPAGNAQDVARVIALLQEFRTKYPGKTVYVFGMIPRLLVGDWLEGEKDKDKREVQQKLLEYSMLEDKQDKYYYPEHVLRLELLRREIPAAVRERYEQVYSLSRTANTQLIELVKQNIVDYLVIGQDDSHPAGIVQGETEAFGRGIMERRKLQLIIDEAKLNDKVMLTAGADELAADLIARYANQRLQYTPKVFIHYADYSLADIVMPYMPINVQQAAEEKIRIVNARQVDYPAEADYILFMHVGSGKTNFLTKIGEARSVGYYLAAGRKVAVVDLSQHGDRNEYFYPNLQSMIDLTRLVSYGSWNTTGNSIGTAVAQGSLYAAALQRGVLPPAAAARAWQAHLQFLTARFLDDWYYQKDVQRTVESVLDNAGANKYDLGDKYGYADNLVREKLEGSAGKFYWRNLRNRSFTIPTTEGPLTLRCTAARFAINLPWARTFEVNVQPFLELRQ